MTTFIRTIRRITLSLAVLIAPLLLAAGCGLGMDNADRLERARTAFAASEFRAAIVDTRNILQEEPDNREARLLLGRAALRVNDAATAEKELHRAIELGTDRGAVAAELGQALLALRRYEALLEEITPELAATAADRLAILRLRGAALSGLDRPGEARARYQEVLADDASDVQALLGVASTFVAEQDYAEARQFIDSAIAVDASHVQARLASGSLYLATHDTLAAIGELEQAVALAGGPDGDRHEAIAALSGLIEAQLAHRDLPAAKKALTDLQALAPDNLSTVYLNARIAFLGQDYELALTELQKLLRAAPNALPAKFMMGAVQLQRGNLGQAEMHLSSVVAAEPRNADARKLLAEIRIRQDRTDEATDILRPLLEPNADPGALNLAVRASLEAGDVDDAIGYLRTAHEQRPDAAEIQLDLAAAYLAAGDIGEAEALLESAPSGTARTDYRRELLQVITPLRRGDATTALADAQAMAVRWPEDARVQSLVGGIALSLQNPDLARASFTAARALAPDDLSTYLSLADLDLRQGDLAGARAQYAAALERQPEAIQPMLAMAKLEARAGDMDAAVQWLEKARVAHPSATGPRVLLARIYLERRDYAAAQEAAARMVELQPASAEAHNLLGLAQQGLNETAAALASFSEAGRLAPQESEYRINKARVELAAGDTRQAERTLVGDGLDLDDVRSAVMVAALRARAGEAETAMKIARDLQARHPDRAVPYALEAELLAAAQQYQSAARAYDKALSLRPEDPNLATRAYGVRATGDIADRTKPLTDYLARRPLDAAVRVVVAQDYQAHGQGERAIAEYERVLETEPDHLVALNNLAWEYFVAGDPRAEATAQRALAQAPGNGSVADTLGWIQVKAGKLEEGVAMLRKAVELSGGNPEVQYHLAAGLAAAGEADEARRILEGALAAERGLASRTEAEELLETL